MNYKPIIGLEVHVELKTKSKMFCRCSADYFGQKPNTHTCPVCLGLPGALPVPNRKAIEWCVMIGLALNCKIAGFSKFDRKNYFYPDLPKGYQISQYDEPFCQGGYVILSGTKDPISKKRDSSATSQNDVAAAKRIGITRVHMEEDTAKLTHQDGDSLIDFNRSGVPLVEIVTEPDFENAKEVVEYLKELQQIVRYLGVSNANMEEGNMRLEPNISLKKCHPEQSEGSWDSSATPQNDTLPPYKVEVKNINSFRFVEKAIEYEIKRQTEILNEGKTPIQETRGWDENKQKTVSQRIKEEAQDYRYFPEPDIPPIRFTQNKIRQLADQMPELPSVKLKRLIKEFELSPYDAEIITREKETTDYFDEAIRVVRDQIKNTDLKVSPKIIANWIINKKIDINKILPEQLIIEIILAGQVSSITEVELETIVGKVLKENQEAVSDYKSGKTNALMFLLGQVLRTAKQKLDTSIIKNILIKKLK